MKLTAIRVRRRGRIALVACATGLLVTLALATEITSITANVGRVVFISGLVDPDTFMMNQDSCCTNIDMPEVGSTALGPLPYRKTFVEGDSRARAFVDMERFPADSDLPADSGGILFRRGTGLVQTSVNQEISANPAMLSVLGNDLLLQQTIVSEVETRSVRINLSFVGNAGGVPARLFGFIDIAPSFSLRIGDCQAQEPDWNFNTITIQKPGPFVVTISDFVTLECEPTGLANDASMLGGIELALDDFNLGESNELPTCAFLIETGGITIGPRADIGAFDGFQFSTLVLPDVNGAPAAVMQDYLCEELLAGVFDFGTGSALGDFEYTSGLVPIQSQPAADSNGNGADDVVNLSFNEEDVKPFVEVWDPLAGKVIRNVPFNFRQHRPVGLAILGDQNGNQSQEALVLAERLTDGVGRLLIRDLVTKAKINNVRLPKIFKVQAVDAGEDFSGNGKADVAVLALRRSDRLGFLLIWDTGGGGKINNINFPKDHTPIGHALISGPGGALVVALSLREADQRLRLLGYDPLTRAKLWGRTVPREREGLQVDGYLTPAGEPRVAVLYRDLTNDTAIVTVYDGNTGGVMSNVSFDGEFPLSFSVVPDTNLDAGNDAEFSVLIRDMVDSLALEVRDSVSKGLLTTIDPR